MFIDWNRGELRPAPRKNNPSKRETFYPVKCDCGREYWLTRCNALSARQCSTCQRRAAGKRGYRAFVQKFGKDRGAMMLREYRLNNPEAGESLVASWLEQAGVCFEREYVFHAPDDKVYFFDFVSGNTAIEINGWGHKLQNRAERDKYLQGAWAGKVIFVPLEELAGNPEATRAMILEELA